MYITLVREYRRTGVGYGVGRQNAGGQNASQICIGGQNAGRFSGMVDKMPVLSNHIEMKNDAEKQVNTNILTQKYIFKYWQIKC